MPAEISKSRLLLCGLLLGALAIPTTEGEAQRRRTERWERFDHYPSARTVTLQVGTFTHDYYDDEASPMGALRLNWGVARWVLTELGVFYTQPETSDDETVHMTGVDVGVQAQLPHSFISPYVGLATGIHYTDEGDGGDSYFAGSTQAMGGIRLWLSRSVGIRGEGRFRIDDQQNSPNAADNFELTAGLMLRW